MTGLGPQNLASGGLCLSSAKTLQNWVGRGGPGKVESC